MPTARAPHRRWTVLAVRRHHLPTRTVRAAMTRFFGIVSPGVVIGDARQSDQGGRSMPSRPLRATILLLFLLGGVTTALGQSFVTFETGQVRPLALSPDGTHLFAINTPDNRLEIFDVAGAAAPSPGALTHSGSVPVGLRSEE